MPYLSVRNIRLFYNERGKGFPLILIHGNGGSSKMLKTEIRYYSKYFRVIAFDLPGHGRSDRIYDFEGDFWQYSAFLIKKALKLLDINELYILGTNGGAIVGFHLTLDTELKVKAIVADSFEGLALSPERAKNFIAQREKTMQLNFFKMFFQYLHGKDWMEVLRSDSRHHLHFAEHKTAWFDSLENINTHVLITALKNDNLIPQVEEKMRIVSSLIKNSEIEIFTKGKHPAMLSNKKRYRKLVCNFLSMANKRTKLQA